MTKNLMIGQGETVSTTADDVDTMVDGEPILPSYHAQEMPENTPRPHPLVSAPQQHTPETCPGPWTPETDLLSVLEGLGLVIMQKPCLAALTVRDAEAAGNTSDVDVYQRQVGGSACSYSLSYAPLPDVPLSNMPHREAHPDALVGEKWTSSHVWKKAIVVGIILGTGSVLECFVYSKQFVLGIDYYTRPKVFGSLRVYFIYGFFIGFILFIVLCDIVHAAYLELLACKEPPSHGVDAQ